MNWNQTDLRDKNLLGGKELDDPHEALAARAMPDRRFRDVWLVGWRCSRE
jgi:hypothetical protein